MSDADIGRDDGEEKRTDRRNESLGDALDALASEKRRYVLHFFQNQTRNVATVEDLAAYILEHDRTADDLDRVCIALHHRELPTLDDASLIDYDARSNTVRYHGESTAEDLLEYLSGSE